MKQYLDLLREIREKGTRKGDRTGTGTISLFGYQMRMDLQDGFPLLTTKKLPFRWIAEELFWMLSGSTYEPDLREKGIDIWKEWATAEQTARFGRQEGDLGPVYGKQFRSFGDWNPGRVQRVSPRAPSEQSMRRADSYCPGDGSFEVMERVGSDDEGRPLVRVRFASGFERVARRDAVKMGRVGDPYAITVAGVGYLGEYDRSHPLGERLKKIWSHMMDRCYTPSCKEYRYYGAKGISVCQRWMSFAAFLDDVVQIPGYHQMRSNPSGYHLDKDHFHSVVYSPETTIWAPRWVNRSYAHWAPFEAVAPDGTMHRHGSASMFAQLHDLDGHSVSRCLRGERPHHKGWTFRMLRGGDIRYEAPFDQLAQVVELLIENPNSRRIILSGWNPAEATQVALPPCHTLTQFYVANGKLSAQMYQRSADVFLGVPFNIASYALLTHMLAHVTGLEVGEFVHTFGDVHIYLNHQEQVEEQLSRGPLVPLPRLTIEDNINQHSEPGWALAHMLNIRYEHLKLKGYSPHPKIAAPVSV